MKHFVDASVFVAILGDEHDGREWLERLDSSSRTGQLITSPLAIWETVRALARLRRASIKAIEEEIHELRTVFRIAIVTIGEHEGRSAIMAHVAFGKGRHPARLNMGDCFAYACAKANDARLLYKGDDFVQTDLA